LWWRKSPAWRTRSTPISKASCYGARGPEKAAGAAAANGVASEGENMNLATSGQTVHVPVGSVFCDTLRGFRFDLDPLLGGGLVALDLPSGKILC
jgi:hypothetical protein